VNGCFDVADVDGYTVRGNADIIDTQGTIRPLQGGGMLRLTTGSGSVDETTSSLEMAVRVPAGASEVTFSYRFFSDEYPSFLGSEFNDLFDVFAYTPSGALLIVEERLNSAMITPSTDGYGGQTPWLNVSFPVAEFAGDSDPVTFQFVVSDVGDSAYDSAVLVDRLAFDGGTCDGASATPPAGN
jgi:hypothetical protein